MGLGLSAKTLGGPSSIPATVDAFRNRVINGEPRIDQRNVGASASCASNATTKIVDRFSVTLSSGVNAVTAQQSTDVPAGKGFQTSLKITAGTGAAVGASDYLVLQHTIEGYNIADALFGSANARQVSISVWLKSSVTGTYVINLRNNASNRGYPATCIINSANTWEYKTITLTADTTGTWEITNLAGLLLQIELSGGTTYNHTANTWNANGFGTVAGQAQLSATTAATFYMTGLQVEVGGNPTQFEFRPYDIELLRCFRYYYKLPAIDDAINFHVFGLGFVTSTTNMRVLFVHPVKMRAQPSLTYSALSDFEVYNGTIAIGGTMTAFALTNANSPTATAADTTWPAASFSTNGLVAEFTTNNTTAAWIAFDADI